MEATLQKIRKIPQFLGRSPAHRGILKRVSCVRDLDVPVFIWGESGTGKELVARNIHESGKRSGGRFVSLNCSAIPEYLLESELFGYTRGAFTGAVRSKSGLIEEAHEGTFFLDEIADLSPHLQAKLLRVFQEKEIRRIGENHTRMIDVRFISATNKNIEEEISAGRFREDLYYRLKIITITIPPLRERKEDLLYLLDYLVNKFRREMDCPSVEFSPRAVKLLMNYHWPGNVRELQNEVLRCLILGRDSPVIDVPILSRKISEPDGENPSCQLDFFQARAAFERKYIMEALLRCNFHRNKTACDIGVSRQGLFKLIKKHNIPIPDRT